MSQPIIWINKETGCAVKLSILYFADNICVEITLMSTFEGENIYMTFSPQEFIWLQNVCTQHCIYSVHLI